ncbi:hypothetical protein Scep_004641 [Stephania cephalantha]|uniref:Uncharacterized protein n=1 Tax=Stephania cephalantha TaxID=152367 RepID=A0AAP0KSV0_9MAGN
METANVARSNWWKKLLVTLVCMRARHVVVKTSEETRTKPCKDLVECTSTDPDDHPRATAVKNLKLFFVRTSWTNRKVMRGAGVKRKSQEETTNFKESVATRIPRHNQLFLVRCVHEGVPQLRHLIVPLHPISCAMRVSRHILR